MPHLNPDWFYLSGAGLSWKIGHQMGVVVVVDISNYQLHSVLVAYYTKIRK